MRVLLADDHQIVLESLAVLLAQQVDIQIVAKATNGLEALQLIEQIPVDIVVTDLNMPLLGGIEFTLQLRERFPHIKVLLLTMVEKAAQVREAVQAGVWGYVLKSASPDELRKAITEIAAGRRYFSNDIQKQLTSVAKPPVVKDPSPPPTEGVPNLTNREIEIIRYIIEDL